MLLSSGMALQQNHVSANSKRDTIVRNANLSHHQAKHQNQEQIINQVKEIANHKRSQQNWFTDGLNSRQLRARGWITKHESGNHWRILSYGHVCVGYFQLNPHYLGYKHGHVNLNHKHQVKVADTYAKNRYGSWVHAKGFWQVHHWY